MWEENAEYVFDVYGTYVNWDEKFYICPNCGELIYKDDWTEEYLYEYLCPICEGEI